MSRLRLVLAASCLAAPRLAEGQLAEPADLLITDTTVYTVDLDRPRATALALKGDRIVAVGSPADVRRHMGRNTRVLRLRGRMVLPGFIDAHTQFERAGRIDPEVALEELRRYGVTSIQDVTGPEQLRRFQQLRRAGKLTVRVWARPTLERIEQLDALGIETGFGNDWVRVGGPFGSGDSALLGRADRLHLPPSLEPGEGPEVSALLDTFQALIEGKPVWDRRIRIVHDGLLETEHFGRMGELALIAEVRPYVAIEGMQAIVDRVGRQRAMWADAYRSILEGGARLAFGSGWPGTEDARRPVNPLLGIYAAVTRKTRSGEPPGGWFPQHCLTVPEAIEAYTMGPAYAAYEDDIKGSITVGKLADLVVLSKDITRVRSEEIPEVEVLMTILGGETIFDAER